ncbi:MAG: SGNH/GDSL hydrolase family protein [Chloroflexi bacterium]|nr:SGNH/GDSL hydrolase family protein [Chloroflexota bacterium]
MKIHPNSKFIMIGDSITDCGRTPTEHGEESLGNGYVRLINSLITATYPTLEIQIINKGISGNTVRDLKNRWQKDVPDLAPDWLSIMIGINDVWLNFDDWMPAERKISIEEYEDTLDELVGNVFPSLKGLVLMTPYLLQPDRADPMRALMDRFGAVVHKLANKYNVIYVDTQTAFDEFLVNMKAEDLSEDRVHLNLTGHMILARSFLKAVEYAW